MEMNDRLLTELNAEYHMLEMKMAEVMFSLFHRIFDLESGWYNGYYDKNEAGEWILGSYPIPVVSVKGLCDIEIRFDSVFVSAKLKRSTALAHSFDKLSSFEFYACDDDDFFTFFHQPGQSVQDMKAHIRTSDARAVRFSFIFPFEVEGKQLFELAKLLRREGFYF